jgi:murein DD-endopeptidase MepM/ murein hydrolase activator NlpD
MRAVVLSSCWRLCSRAAFVGAVAAGFAGCSADSNRFGNPNASPYASHASAPAEYTGTVQAAPVSQVSAQPLPPPPNASRPATVASAGVSGGGPGMGPGMGSYNPASAPAVAPPPAAPPHASLPPPPAHDVTGSVPAQSWSRNGGTAIVVGQGESLDSLARKYGVPPSAILQANNLTGPAAIQPGQRIVIPRYNLAAAAPASAPPQPARPSVAPAGPAPAANVHVVAPGETLMSIARRYKKSLARIAAANNIPPQTHVKIGDRIIIPGRAIAALQPAAPPPALAAPKVQAPAHAQAPAAPPPVAAAETTSSARVVSPGAQATAEAPSFRWPVRGRVISGFPQSDGLDLAVPEGTAVHAAEDGVVAYAGNELKGYGNLILIRHANGFVTAYAHASELMVKRNDTVKRGQIIAKSGQSGNVTSPQLHFEIRKGSSPVDPAQYLPSGA